MPESPARERLDQPEPSSAEEIQPMDVDDEEELSGLIEPNDSDLEDPDETQAEMARENKERHEQRETEKRAKKRGGARTQGAFTRAQQRARDNRCLEKDIVPAWKTQQFDFAQEAKERGNDYRAAAEEMKRVAELCDNDDERYALIKNAGILVEAVIDNVEAAAAAFYGVAKTVRGFEERKNQHKDLWSRLRETESRYERNRKQISVAQGAVQAKWGQVVFDLLTGSSANSSYRFWSDMRALANKTRSWEEAAILIQKAMHARLTNVRKGKTATKTITPGDIHAAIDLKKDAGDILALTAGDLKEIGCQVDGNGILRSTVLSNHEAPSKELQDSFDPNGSNERTSPRKRSAEGSIEATEKQRRTESDNVHSRVGELSSASIAEGEAEGTARQADQVAGAPADSQDLHDTPSDVARSVTRKTQSQPVEQTGDVDNEDEPGETSPRDCHCVQLFSKEDLKSIETLTDDGASGAAESLLSLYRRAGYKATGCEMHHRAVFRALGLKFPSTGTERERRLGIVLGYDCDMDDIREIPGLAHWFNSKPCARSALSMSVFEEEGSYSFDTSRIDSHRLDDLLGKFLPGPFDCLNEDGVISMGGALTQWLESTDGGEPLYEIALREAWMYAYHTGEPVKEVILDALQHGVVQQALRSTLLIYLLNVRLRGDHEMKLYTYPSAAEWSLSGAAGRIETYELLPVQYEPSGKTRNELIYMELSVLPPKETDGCPLAIQRRHTLQDGKDLQRALQMADNKYDSASTVNWESKTREVQRQEADKGNLLRYGTQRGDLAIFKPTCPRIFPQLEAPSTYLRYQLTMVASRGAEGSEHLERDCFGTLKGLKCALKTLGSTGVLYNGLSSPGAVGDCWAPTTRIIPRTSIAAAISGDGSWDDPTVQQELELLLTGPIHVSIDKVATDLANAAMQARAGWKSFLAAEAAIYQECSAAHALETEMKKRRVETIEALLDSLSQQSREEKSTD